MSTQTIAERRLIELELVIEHGLETFVEVGNALREIRNEGLYKATHSRFDDYCKERWGWNRQRSYQLMDAAAVSTLVDISSERQARELAPLKDQPEALIAAWDEARAISNGEPTAAVIRGVVRPEMAVHYTSTEDDWRTPPHVIEAVVSCLGTIDLDPCSNDGSPNIPAGSFFTEADDGLSKDWFGNVYMNPPYGRGIDKWVGKLAAGYQSGTIKAAVALVPARTDTAWFRILRDAPVCFISGRLRFSEADPAPFPSAAAYFGADIEGFRTAFEPLGDVWQRLT